MPEAHPLIPKRNRLARSIEHNKWTPEARIGDEFMPQTNNTSKLPLIALDAVLLGIHCRSARPQYPRTLVFMKVLNRAQVLGGVSDTPPAPSTVSHRGGWRLPLSA